MTPKCDDCSSELACRLERHPNAVGIDPLCPDCHHDDVDVAAWNELLDVGDLGHGDINTENLISAWGAYLLSQAPHEYRGRHKLASPTGHRPGSPGKESVLRQRYEKGQCLWHPEDSPPADDDGLATIPICAANNKLVGRTVVEERSIRGRLSRCS